MASDPSLTAEARAIPTSEAEEERIQHLHTLRQQNLRSLVVNLPSKLLELIFELACYPSAPVDLEQPLSYVLGPQLRGTRNAISSTCFRWRQVVLGALDLWSTITARSSSATTSPHPSLLSLELERSREQSLSLQLQSYAGAYGTDIVSTMLPTLPRCKVLHFTTVSPDELSMVARTINVAQSRLRTLVVHLIKILSYAPITGLWYRVALDGVLTLRHLWISYPETFQTPNPPLELLLPQPCGITWLSLETSRQSIGIFPLLGLCPCLETFYLQSGGITDTMLPLSYDAPKLEPLHHLRHLCLIGDHAVVLLRHVSAPQLERLLVSPSTTQSNQAAISRIISGFSAAPSLRHAELQQSDTYSDAYASLLSNHLGLNEVILDRPLSPLLINCFSTIPLPGQGFAMAELQRLWVPSHGLLDLETIAELLQQRLKYSEPGQSFTLYSTWDMRPIVDPAKTRLVNINATYKKHVSIKWRKPDSLSFWHWKDDVNYMY